MEAAVCIQVAITRLQASPQHISRDPLADSHVSLSKSASVAESFGNIFSPLREYQVILLPGFIALSKFTFHPLPPPPQTTAYDYFDS
jgi:hypothetical protein